MPEIGQIGGDIIARNLDFDGAEELADRLKAMLPPQVLQLQQGQDGQPMQAPPPDPMAEMQMQGQAQAMETELQAGQAKAAQEAAKAEQEKAKAEQELHRVDGAKLDNALKLKKLREPSPHQMAENEPMEAGT